MYDVGASGHQIISCMRVGQVTIDPLNGVLWIFDYACIAGGALTCPDISEAQDQEIPQDVAAY